MSFVNWNLKKLILVNKIWPNDPKVGCKPPFNLIEFLKKDIDFLKKREKFEGDFKNDKVVEVWKLCKCKLNS